MLRDVREMLSRHWREFLYADLGEKGNILIGLAGVCVIVLLLFAISLICVGLLFSVCGEPKYIQINQQPQIQMRTQVLENGEWKTVQ